MRLTVTTFPPFKKKKKKRSASPERLREVTADPRARFNLVLLAHEDDMGSFLQIPISDRNDTILLFCLVPEIEPRGTQPLS